MKYTLKEVLDIIHSGEWFCCKVVKADRRKGEAGGILVIDKCRMVTSDNSAASIRGQKANADAVSRSPNHQANFTRNVVLAGGRTVKVRPLLVFEINNQQVI